MAKELPSGFKSFCDFLWFMQDRYPDILKKQKIVMKTFSFESGIQEYSISKQTLINKCFKEILQDVPGNDEIVRVLQVLYTQHCYVRLEDYRKTEKTLNRFRNTSKFS